MENVEENSNNNFENITNLNNTSVSQSNSVVREICNNNNKRNKNLSSLERF